MPLDENTLNQLVRNPVESLTLELKSWIDPSEPSGKAKIIKACIAMRNQNGGYLLIGFKDENGCPDLENAPDDVLALFHTDHIQALVSRYSSETFEVSIYYPEIEGKKFVVIEAPSGVKTPVATKAELNDANQKVLLNSNRVIVRSMNANNTASTTEATWKDWPGIVEICFENREADIGRFLRRQLSGISRDRFNDFFQLVGHAEKEMNSSSLAKDLLEISIQRFNALVSEREVKLPKHGSMEVAAYVVGELHSFDVNSDFLNLLSTTNPRYSGWPVWGTSGLSADQSSKPFVYQGYWEALMVRLQGDFYDNIDFWRLSPKGSFYLYRGLRDDIGKTDRSPKLGTALDFGLVIRKVAECISVAIDFAKAMGAGENDTISFAFRWKGLKGRKLCSWANPERMLHYHPEAYQDDLSTEISIPIDTAKIALSGYVHQVTNDLFQVFDGYTLPEAATEDIVKKMIERRT